VAQSFNLLRPLKRCVMPQFQNRPIVANQTWSRYLQYLAQMHYGSRAAGASEYTGHLENYEQLANRDVGKS